MQTTSFKIYNASAGSGKTHTLVKEYLKIALSENNSFKNILAITFTNKAVNEMKERVLSSLFDFSLQELPDKSKSLFLDVMKELDVSAEQLRKKSDYTLKYILHNYAFFDVSTIDKFTHRVIRTFAKDLKLPQNFEPIVETDLLLDEAISRVVQKAGSDKQLTRTLIEFALEKIDDNRSWDISFDLNKIGQLIFQENHANHLEKLALKKMPDFIQLKKIITQRINDLENELIGLATDSLEEITKSGLQLEDFPRQTLPNHFKKFLSKEFNPSTLYNNKLQENLEKGTILKKGVEPPSNEFLETMLNNYIKLKATVYNRSFLNNIYRNLVPLTVLSVIQQEVIAIEKERDQIPIFKFNQIISKEIKNQPAPFIYERLGEKYRHYFIDEFQDTSAAQWGNLVPLIDNALASEGGSLFLVGDAKQAIYRWRGGKAEQFIDLAGDFKNPFVIQPEVNNLPVNYRSFDEVIQFNNDFFSWSSDFLNKKTYQSLFVEGNQQQTNAKKGGYVKLDFISKETEVDTTESYCQQVLSTINEIKEKNYPYKDITILVRSNTKGAVLADYLSENDIPIISSDSLLLKSSSKVRFLINLLSYATGFQERALAYDILEFLAPTNSLKHEFIYMHLEKLDSFLNTEYNFLLSRTERLSAFDSLEYAIRQFNLAPTSDAYLIFLMDTLLDIEKRDGGSIQYFLNYWEKKKDKLAIASPENLDAIRIMTIHKSKGLEFPIVIFPFADANIYNRTNKMLWSPTDPKLFNGFDEMLLTEKSELEDYPNEAATLFEDEEQMMELDAMNVLYVAQTRAEKALYIISEKKSTKSKNNKTGSYSEMYMNYLITKNLWQDDLFSYEFGSLEKSENNTSSMEVSETLPYQYSFRDRPDFNIVTSGGMLWNTNREEALSHGTLIHHILGLIETENNLEKALEAVLKNGDITKDEIVSITNILKKIVEHDKLKEYFSDKYTILNERDILTAEGKLLRPDRIAIFNNEATVIDYKTGMKNPKHKEQIYSYADALLEIGYVVKNKIIVYINTDIRLDFV
ncbi:UvrD-helicase domain-containing protein [Aurantibacter sp.]|uniref:UvrD-helicase domain-containing protein n=1 Tax=Aurantibacter sp. TaxID=2807103 RepID=UPI0032677A4D